MKSKPKTKTRKILPFAWVDHKWSIFGKRATRDWLALERGLRALVRRFGFQRVLASLVHLAGNEALRELPNRTLEGRLYYEASTILDHADKTLSTIARLEKELANTRRR